MTTVHLIDASPYFFRSFFALPSSIVDPRGRPANAIYGFTRFLIEYIESESPTHLGIAFDESLTTSFRNRIYPDYKAQRDLPPPELEAQQSACRDAARAIGAITWSDSEYEADDLIATAIARFDGDGVRFVVVSPDKDLAQLVTPSVQLHDWARKIRYGPAEVREKFGVEPARVVDLLALAGDAVDNIPGVRGIGPKTAAALIEHLGSFDDIYRRLDEISSLPLRGAASTAAKLREHREIAEISRTLATVSIEAPVTESLDELRWTGSDAEAVERFCERYGFGGVRSRMRGLAAPGAADYVPVRGVFLRSCSTTSRSGSTGHSRRCAAKARSTSGTSTTRSRRFASRFSRPTFTSRS